MTPDQIQSELNRLQSELDALKSNLSEIPNSCDHYIPQPGEVKDYTHLLPTGYEFCTEEQAEKWVKVENHFYGSYSVGDILLGKPVGKLRDCSRPIRPIQYHVSLHEAVTAEPNPYQVDWSNAPDDADVHAFDEEGDGNWYIVDIGNSGWLISYESSGFELPTGLDWKQSKTVRPCKQ